MYCANFVWLLPKSGQSLTLNNTAFAGKQNNTDFQYFTKMSERPYLFGLAIRLPAKLIRSTPSLLGFPGTWRQKPQALLIQFSNIHSRDVLDALDTRSLSKHFPELPTVFMAAIFSFPGKRAWSLYRTSTSARAY